MLEDSLRASFLWTAIQLKCPINISNVYNHIETTHQRRKILKLSKRKICRRSQHTCQTFIQPDTFSLVYLMHLNDRFITKPLKFHCNAQKCRYMKSRNGHHFQHLHLIARIHCFKTVSVCILIIQISTITILFFICNTLFISERFVLFLLQGLVVSNIKKDYIEMKTYCKYV